MIATPLRPRVRALSSFLLLGFILACAPLACTSQEKPSREISPSLVEIVKFQTHNVLRSATTGKPALRSEAVAFATAHARAAARAELVRDWKANAALARLADLEEDVFKPATEDGDWESEAAKAGFASGGVPDEVFVTGFKDGVKMLEK